MDRCQRNHQLIKKIAVESSLCKLDSKLRAADCSGDPDKVELYIDAVAESVREYICMALVLFGSFEKDDVNDIVEDIENRHLYVNIIVDASPTNHDFYESK